MGLRKVIQYFLTRKVMLRQKNSELIMYVVKMHFLKLLCKLLYE